MRLYKHPKSLFPISLKQINLYQGNKEGEYTVRSGYHKIKQWESQQIPTTSRNEQNEEIWKRIWKIRVVPNKQAHLLLRILKNVVLVGLNLHAKGVNCPLICPKCHKYIESIDHVFRDCIWVTHIWLLSPLDLRFENLCDRSFVSCLNSFIMQALEETVELCVSILYGIWWAWNKRCLEDIQNPVPITIDKACSTILEYKRNSLANPIHRATNKNHLQKSWKVPPENVYKINTNAMMSVTESVELELSSEFGRVTLWQQCIGRFSVSMTLVLQRKLVLKWGLFLP